VEVGLTFLIKEEVGLTIVDGNEDDDEDEDDGGGKEDGLMELLATMYTNVPDKKTKVRVKVFSAIFCTSVSNIFDSVVKNSFYLTLKYRRSTF
jgi:hypothetical protein